MASTISVPNETESRGSRITKEGKKITYQLTVIQEPERARACGSGAKSSADRRPVDPPPIVQLRVFENGEEVTFQYNASFFLFATLENARHIAQPRVPPSPASVPVLTGTPVAGMAYLDRPFPAGYFIFPDLSVRHEGKYRLSFSLYEELKEQKDMDTEEIANLEVLAQTSQHVSHRLEVKSKPFTVFSAKKFPGLTESTALSRTVAEQGCRVRIRRDVRMRRRENKSNKDEWDFDEEAAMEHARQSRTPDAYGQQGMTTPQPTLDGSDRPRSVSNASVASFGMPQRRPSMEQMAQGYQQPYAPHISPQAPQNMYPPQMPYSAPQQQQAYAAPYQPPQQPIMQPPQLPYQQPAQQYQQPQPQMQMSNGYGYMPQQFSQPQPPAPQPAYDQTQHVRHNSIEYPTTPQDYRRPSMTQAPAQAVSYPAMAPPTSAPFPQIETSYTPTTQAMPTAFAPTTLAPATQSLAPLRTLQPSLAPAKAEPTSPSYNMSNSAPLSAESVHSPGFHDLPRAVPPVFQPHMPSNAQLNGSGKRTFSATFDTHHMEQPLRYGARPNVTGHDDEYQMPHGPPTHYSDGSDGESPDASAMSYRRADGTERRRKIPNSN
ncbi:hypothetical protein NA57DRAFT_41735 [Rhizodiscina lignyota]|uniref:Velvet domain-containing protein n=1 Tax=Rhizodiscina lignyota TaxID=1504668 RepID=A0A9P4ICG1_9PEZI|nr:hypothetical protein NA57DRAFT_41735 [Rhizodiscina lignyota]